MPRRDPAISVIPYLGWKREGQRPFQESRLDLVRVLDRLIRTLTQDSSHPGVLLGGETIILDDYREIRDDSYQAIEQLVQSRRFIVGPWYVLPHEFLASSESLVRNLLLGIGRLQEGGVTDTPGYLAPNGIHIGQMPQILGLFGIQTIIIPEQFQQLPHSRQQWAGSDGSRLNVLQIPVASFHSQDEHHQLESENAPVNSIVLAEIDLIDGDCADFVATGPTAYSQLEAASNASKLAKDSVIVDLSDPLNAPYPEGTFSARMWIKQRNHLVESLLTGWAEPFSAWSSTIAESQNGVRPSLNDPNGILRFAWQALLKNQSFEVLSGNVVDLSADEAAVRFDRAEQIASYVIDGSLQVIAGQIDTSSLLKRKQSYPIAIFNGTAISHREVASVTIPADLGAATVEVVNTLGKTVPIDILADQNDPLASSHVEFVADIPATGYTTYALRKSRKTSSPIETDSGDSIENEYLTVQIDATDGTFSLYDKRTARLFSGLNRYRDGGDCGNLAYYQSPEHDTIIDIATNTPLRPQRKIGNVVQSLDLFQIFRLPQTLTEDRSSRLPLTAQFVPVSIWTTIRLARGIPRVDVDVTISNAAMDHRLRVHFPTEIRNAKTYLDGHFEVRHVPLQPDTNSPQGAFVTVVGSEAGLTISNRGLPEVSISQYAEGAEVALTLLRGAGMMGLETPTGDALAQVLTPKGQCLGEYSYRYSLIPHDTDLLSAWREAWADQSDAIVVDIINSSGEMPSTGSFVDCDNHGFLITGVKQAADASNDLIVRGYNVTSTRQKVTLLLAVPIQEVICTGLNEQSPIEKKVKVKHQRNVTFEADPLEIVTLRFVL